MKNTQLKLLLKNHLECERDETVDFIWNQLAKTNIKLDTENKDMVLAEGQKILQKLLKDW
tara:strand:- start:350 stop:529 length:180 start_codon:yes stop_codon:yes gene_type:complete